MKFYILIFECNYFKYMKKVIQLLLIFISVYNITPVTAQNIIEKESIAGSWMGKLDINAISLRIIFNLTLTGKDSLAATLDSPDQGAKDITVGPVTLDSNIIKIQAPLLMAEYNGTIKNDTLIEGTFSQSGMNLPLTLTKLRRAFSMNRPQEPKPPFPYRSQDIKFSNKKAGIELAGTLTIPEGDGPFPAVILITGSGTQNRDEEIMGHKPFLVIADHLTRNGIAVLRYDDRGIGQSQGTPLNMTSADFAGDAEAAFIYLRNRNDIDSLWIGLAGHSEGGLIASIVASENPEIAFLISLAGPGVPGDQVMNRQNRDISRILGADDKQIEEAISINRKIFGILKSVTDNSKAESQIRELYTEIMTSQNKSQEEIDSSLKRLNVTLNPASYNWMRFFISTDPAKYWEKVKCPVLALNGEKDLQVAADENLEAIEKALRSGGNKAVTTISLPDLNHLFQHCTTGLPTEYSEIEETFSQEALKIISDWIVNLYDSRPAF
jgi:pimeloyl-ACP methyl ester carboxylesterase